MGAKLAGETKSKESHINGNFENALSKKARSKTAPICRRGESGLARPRANGAVLERSDRLT